MARPRARFMTVPYGVARLVVAAASSPPSEALGDRLKAMTRVRYGSADVLALNDVAMPVAGDDEVLIRVRAAGVGPEVWHLMTGRPYFVRLMGFGLRKPKVRVVGRDVAGSVEAVGRNVTQFRAGDEVFGTCRGGFAEYACAAAGSEGGVGGDGPRTSPLSRRRAFRPRHRPPSRVCATRARLEVGSRC